jgi:hypothetical protein
LTGIFAIPISGKPNIDGGGEFFFEKKLLFLSDAADNMARTCSTRSDDHANQWK